MSMSSLRAAPEGEWADGRATETLELFARAGAGRIPVLGGRTGQAGVTPTSAAMPGRLIFQMKGEADIAWSGEWVR